MGHLKYGLEMEKNRKKRYIKKEKKTVWLASGIKMENLN